MPMNVLDQQILIGEIQFSARRIVNVTCFADNSFERSQQTRNFFDVDSSEKENVMANLIAANSSDHKPGNQQTFF